MNILYLTSSKLVVNVDAGEWTCGLESYTAGRYRGYGYLKTGRMMIDIATRIEYDEDIGSRYIYYITFISFILIIRNTPNLHDKMQYYIIP